MIKTIICTGFDDMHILLFTLVVFSVKSAHPIMHFEYLIMFSTIQYIIIN